MSAATSRCTTYCACLRGAPPLENPRSTQGENSEFAKTPIALSSLIDSIIMSSRKTPPHPVNPALETAEDYTEKITIRVTPTEKQQLLARCQGIKLSSYIRSGLLDYPMPRPRQVVPIVTRQMYIELNRIGHNLNQQSRCIHEALKLGVALPIDHPEANERLRRKRTEYHFAALTRFAVRLRSTAPFGCCI
jgi:hypothetical protein